MNKMKIGILTFHKTDNYGAMLQAYALSSFLKDLGNSVVFLDYLPAFLKKKKYVHRTFVQKCIFGVKYAILIRTYFSKKKMFADFVQRYFDLRPLSESKKVDVAFIGSDQVWATNLTNYDICFLGTEIESKKIAYAASCGNINKIDEKTKSLYAKYLPDFDCLSVREQETSMFLSSLLRRDVPVVLDPTLLVSNEIFKRIQKNCVCEDYICVYDASHDGVLSAVERFAAKMSYRVIALSCDISFNKRKQLVQDASVEEFLGYIAGARYVFSTSYHGCALAISYKKDFYCFDTGAVSSRSRDLLKQLNLEDRYIKINAEISPESVDYEKVDFNLNILKKFSSDYIQQCLEKK